MHRTSPSVRHFKSIPVAPVVPMVKNHIPVMRSAQPRMGHQACMENVLGLVLSSTPRFCLGNPTTASPLAILTRRQRVSLWAWWETVSLVSYPKMSHLLLRASPPASQLQLPTRVPLLSCILSSVPCFPESGPGQNSHCPLHPGPVVLEEVL